jgi:glycosyltransferase involved in cell wall biosynthesis
MIYQARERTFDWESGEPFKFLWVGAPNARKGWHRLMSVWSYVFEDQKRYHVTFKTTQESDPEGYVAEQGNATYDCRRLPATELAQLYYDHHCFVFPTSGEGFGLTGLESVATGMPIVTVKYSSIVDFLDDTTAYFCSATWDHAEIERGHVYYCPHADVGSLGRRMIDVVKNWPLAQKRARRAAERAHRAWTWDHAGKKLAEALDRMVKREVKYSFTPRERLDDNFLADRAEISAFVEQTERTMTDEDRAPDDTGPDDDVQPPPPPGAEPAPGGEGSSGA